MVPSETRGRVRQIAWVMLLLAMFLILPIGVSAQSCSCGGPPLLGALETSVTKSGQLDLSMTYEFASISDLVDGNQTLPDDIRDRTVNTGLLQIGYGLSRTLSLSVLFSLLEQSRVTSLGSGQGEFLKTNGVGDVMVTIRYAIWPVSVHYPHSLAFGIGLKAPLGKSGLTNGGFLISADMQPGTGSWDMVLLTSGGYTLSRQNRLALFGSGLYRLNGKNDRFGTGSTNYRFGNELLFTLGLSHDATFRLTPSLALRYRSTKADRFNDQDQPNSGGEWLNLLPGVNVNVNSYLKARVSGQIPLYRSIDGVQFSTSYTFAFSLFYSLGKA